MDSLNLSDIDFELDALDELDPESNCLPSNYSNYFSETEFNSYLSSNRELLDTLSLLFLNIRSLPANFSTINDYLSTIDLHCSVLGFAETWLKPEIEQLYTLKDYSYAGVVRKGRAGGGVALQVHKSFTFKEIPHMTYCEESIESVFIEITRIPASNAKPIIGVIYRPPNTNFAQFVEKFEVILNDLNRSKKPCYIMGDFNIDLLMQDNANTKTFSDLLHSNSFFPLFDKPTRIKPPSSTLIDNIFVNFPQHSHLSGILYTDISDHLPLVTINQSISLCRNSLSSLSSFQYRAFSEADVAAFLGRLQATGWDDVLSINCCNDAYTRFSEIFSNLYNESFPVSTRCVNPKKNQPWLNSQLKSLINKKNRLYKVFLRRPSLFNEITYRRAKTDTTRQIRHAKKAYYHNLLEII